MPVEGNARGGIDEGGKFGDAVNLGQAMRRRDMKRCPRRSLSSNSPEESTSSGRMLTRRSRVHAYIHIYTRYIRMRIRTWSGVAGNQPRYVK